MTDDDTLLGHGPETVVSVSMHRGTIGAVRNRAGRSGMSAYIEAAVRRQIDRDNLDDLIEAAEDEHDPLMVEEIDAKRQLLASAWNGRRGPMLVQPCDPRS